MFDAIVVLANLMEANGTLNDESAARVAEAVRLWREGQAPVIVPCGWNYRPDSEIRISEAIKSHAIKVHSVPAPSIVVETLSRDTVGDAVFSKIRIANPRGWSQICVVTSAYHANRTEQIFSFVYGYNVPVFSSKSHDSERLRESERVSLEAFRKTFEGIKAGDDDGIVRRLLNAHPFYNGQALPKMEADALLENEYPA